jgi:hypothetical protein
MNAGKGILWTILLGALMLVASGLMAQSTTGTIYGATLDSTGAAIAGATITAKETHTGTVQTQTTNASGEYVFPAVNPGDYTVTASAAGFKATTTTGVIVASNQNVHVPFNLVIGGATESVEVEAGVTLVDTRESQIGTTIEQARIQDLPTLNRNPYDLVLITPGVSTYTADAQTGSRNGTQFVVNGLPADMTSSYLDGAYSNSFKQGGVNKVPNPDAVQEFRVLTSNFDAEFGRSPGAVINVITRGGTGKFHGSAYDYVRNDRLRSQPYFTQHGTPIQPYKQNQFGGTVGGPVPLLKRTFFFGSYEQLILHQTASITGALGPTALERTGDFSQSKVKPNLSSIETICPGATASYKICSAALDPVALNVLTYYPVSPSGSQVLPQQNAADNTNNYQGLGRIDYDGIHNHAVEMMFFNSQGTQVSPNAGGNQILGYSGMTQTENQINGVLADTWTVSERMVNTFRAFYTDNKYVIANLHNNQFLANLGSAAGEGGPVYAPPQFNISGYATAGPAGAGPSNISQMSYGLVDTAVLTRGRHTIKLGASYVWNPYREDGGASAGATLGFSGAATAAGSVNGNAIADFLLGRAASLVQSSSVHHRTHSFDPALFAQDDWQVTSRLTLNAGLRWEMFPTQCCEPKIVGTFFPGQQSTVIPTAPVGLLYVGDAGIPPSLVNTSLLNFSPRIGFATDVFADGRTSVRGGFGLFYQTIEQFNNGTANQLPYSLSTTINNTSSLVCPYGGCSSLNPSGSDPYPFVYNATAPRFADNATTQAFARGQGTPYVYEYNLAVEQQFGKNYAFHLAYVGNSIRGNLIQIDTNAPLFFPNADTSTNGLDCRRPYQPYRNGGAASTTACTYQGYLGSPALAGPPTGQTNALLTTYAGERFGAVNNRVPGQDGNYNSLQATIRGHVSDKLDMFATYVWSKTLTYEGPTVNNQDLQMNYGPGTGDLRNRFTLSTLAHLPNPRFGGRAARETLGGWQLNVIETIQSGAAFTVTSGVDTNRDGYNNDRVNVIGQPYASSHTRQQKIYSYLNNSSFAIPSYTTVASNPYGGEQRNQFVGPMYANMNLSVFKDFPLYKSLDFQFRAEAFNAIGNVNLGTPRTVFSNFSTLAAGTQMITGYPANADSRVFQFAGKLFF